jgi:hypothetical protein
MTQAAEVVGTVEYREGDGPSLRIRKGPIEVQTTELDATLSWDDSAAGKGTRGSTALPLSDYQRFVDEGAIRVGA